MFIPVGDENPRDRIVPVVTYALIALNVLLFIVELQQPGERALQTFFDRWAVVPVEYRDGVDYAPAAPGPFWVTLFSAMFLHGGLGHIAGNMLYLWIFGDNLEHSLGHARYLVFYLLCGLLASMAHVFTSSGGSSFIPSLGASGAISGVLGGYLLLYPKRRVRVIILRMLTEVPAVFAIGLWFAFQLINGLGMLGSGSQEGGGVAYAAHIGGFIAGLVLIKFFASGRRQPAVSRF